MAYKFILLLLGAYLLGSVPAAYIAAKLALGIDIREYGSGNIGGSNLLRVAPKWISALAFAYDVAKGILPVCLARVIGLSLAARITVGLAAISGHNWSIFLGFSGGRGIATTLGVTLSLMPKLALVLLTVVVGSIPFHQMPLVTLIALWLFPLAGWLSYLSWVGWLLGWQMASLERLLVTIALCGIPVIAIMRRLLIPRSPLAASLSRGELLRNRLLLDRDIKDREAWVNRGLGAVKGKVKS